jgi:glucan phosphorylase
MADKTQINGAIALAIEDGATVESFSLDARVKIFGAGPIVERFIEHQAREMQGKAVEFMRTQLEG